MSKARHQSVEDRRGNQPRVQRSARTPRAFFSSTSVSASPSSLKHWRFQMGPSSKPSSTRMFTQTSSTVTTSEVNTRPPTSWDRKWSEVSSFISSSSQGTVREAKSKPSQTPASKAFVTCTAFIDPRTNTHSVIRVSSGSSTRTTSSCLSTEWK